MTGRLKLQLVIHQLSPKAQAQNTLREAYSERMKSLRYVIAKSWEKSLVLVGALCVLLPVSPLNMQLTYKDSGVFLYTGWRILNGELPYRDIWDHKPPVIFYINALGLGVSDGSRWGVWFLEFVMLFLAALLGFQLIKQLFGLLPSMFSLLVWLLSLVYVLQGGNLTTEYTLPLQFAALWLVHSAGTSKTPDWNFFLIGLTGAVAFFTKQTSIGIWIAIVVFLTFQRLLSKQGRQWAREILLMALGGFLFTAIVIVFLAVQGALPHFWSAAFDYNFVYASRTSRGVAERVDTIVKGIRPLTRAGLFQTAVIGYVTSIVLLLFRRHSLADAKHLVFIGLLNLPLELMLIGLPGRTFAHYYMTLLPVLALFTGVAVWAILSLIPDWQFSNIVKYAMAIAVAGWIVWSSFDGFMTQLYTYREYRKNRDVIQYVQQNTAPDEQILLWGAETSINYFAQRKSPTRFVYQSPLFQENYLNETLINQFLDDVIQNRPRLIIDTNTKNPLYKFPLETDAIQEKVADLEAHYCLVQRIDAWKIYQYKEDGCN